MASNRIMFTIFLLSSSLVPSYCLIKHPPRLIMKLIYHSSTDSPYFNATTTPEDHWERGMQISERRIKHLQSTMFATDRLRGNSIQATITAQPPTPLFLVEVMIGEPPFLQLLAFDTGSSLLWVKCSEGGIYYDPSKSSTYRPIGCFTSLCARYTEDKCSSDSGICQYEVPASNNKITLRKETFRFSTNRSDSKIEDLTFGCAEETTLDVMGNGVLGLGTKPTSLLLQKGYSRFSYCIGNLSDPHYTDNVLIIDEDPIFEGETTPLLIIEDHYHVMLERIYVGGKLLDILMEKDERGTAILDTGASISLLTESAYLKLEEAVIEVIGTALTRTYVFQDKLCYEGMLHTDLQWFPSVVFTLKPDARMQLSYENLFQQRSSTVVCLGVENAAKHGMQKSLIGVNMQQYFYVAYDTQRKVVNMQRTDCDVLWD